ncbi:MAG: PHP domain-containing protein [Euryarchaeota archaeon]|nr:PHP domain-containing protein [Euryarchaeota archaeon]
MKYDFHVHSKYSIDGFLDPEKIVMIAEKKGLNGIAITDHDTIKGGIRAKKYQTENLKVIVGSEITTERGEIIGLFLKDEIKSQNSQDVIHEIKDQGGTVVIPHPFDELRNSGFRPTKKDVKLIDNIEVFNSRCIFQKYNENASIFAKKHKLAVIAGSDAHFVNEIGNGGVFTDNSDIRKAITNNDFKVFGKRSWVINHGFTKVLKLWRKTGYG